jgi:tRNA(fMet)-specific endonuclease VapC
MLLLDTDHFTVLFDGQHRLHATLRKRLDATDDSVAVSVITLEEQLRGWLAEIRRRVATPERQVAIYEQLTGLIDFFARWDILAFDLPAVDIYNNLRQTKMRVGSQDMKIAAIALTHDATVLTANLVDFERVPGLRVDDWLYDGPHRHPR